jgi:hypothetical protein
MIWGVNSRFAHVTNFHTSTTCGVNLLFSMILVRDGQLFKITCYMISCSSVRVPVRINVVGVRCYSSQMSWIGFITFIEAMPASVGHMSRFEAHLTQRPPFGVVIASELLATTTTWRRVLTAAIASTTWSTSVTSLSTTETTTSSLS